MLMIFIYTKFTFTSNGIYTVIIITIMIPIKENKIFPIDIRKVKKNVYIRPKIDSILKSVIFEKSILMMHI